MRIAVSGSHATGKSTLIAAFLAQRPEYGHEPEAYETLADDVALAASEGPDLEGLELLLQHTVSALEEAPADRSFIFERSPVDYLAYASATRTAPPEERRAFIATHVPLVRGAVRRLDLIVFLPALDNGPVQGRPGESAAFRRRVDRKLRRALLDDDHGLFGEPDDPLVRELPSDPRRQLAELLRHVEEAERR